MLTINLHIDEEDNKNHSVYPLWVRNIWMGRHITFC